MGCIINPSSNTIIAIIIMILIVHAPVLKHGLPLVVVQKRALLVQLVELLHRALEQHRDGGVVSEHQAADLVRGLHVRRLAAEGDLDGGRAPRDEVGQLALPDALQRLVDLQLARTRAGRGGGEHWRGVQAGGRHAEAVASVRVGRLAGLTCVGSTSP